MHDGSRFVSCTTTCHPVGVVSESRKEFSGVVTIVEGGSGTCLTSIPPPVAVSEPLHVTYCSRSKHSARAWST
jgi:hypothetical protein